MRTVDLNKIENQTKCEVLQTSQEALPFVDYGDSSEIKGTKQLFSIFP